MSGIKLLPVQGKAAKQISDRFAALEADEERPMENRRTPVPYYQALSAITGAGKTPILAEAVSQMSALVGTGPLVLWISKSRVVVDQTYANFASGGKYSHLIPGFVVTYLSKVTSDQIRDAASPTMLLATVGSFNQKSGADGSLKVHRSAKDATTEPLWPSLRSRLDATGERRPLLIVYDEGQNLSDQQTELLLELEPDAILVASATMRISARLARVVDRFKQAGRTDSDLVTAVPTGPIVLNGLVKQQVVLGGYDGSMELVLDDMIAAWTRAAASAKRLSSGFVPKAIYVARTNMSQDDGSFDIPSRPFTERRAPPILIWRYLVERKKIDPATVAIYADLRLDRKEFPPPPDFNLFSGGEDDYGAFSRGDYQHIIFNQGLQEGWDDPACCFAYIDKSMGSAIQIEQVIGRVLRQYDATIYSDPDLNTASFFIRLDAKQSFHSVLDEVRRKIGTAVPELRLEGFQARSGGSPRRLLAPKEQRSVPEVHVDSEHAIDAIELIAQGIVDYRSDNAGNTVGAGKKVTATVKVGQEKLPSRIKEVLTRHSNRVVARWLLRRKMQSLFPSAVEAVDWSLGKFDARVEITSRAAAYFEDVAEKLVDAFIENSDLVYEDSNPYTVGAVYVNEDKFESFENGLHDGYSDLNELERPLARALDGTGVRWSRNPSNGGYSIPLLEKGTGWHFSPDFLAWKHDVVYLVDPKGGHLLAKDAGRKLLSIADEHGKRRVAVRLVSKGRWQDPVTKISDVGYTVWMLKAGKAKPTHCGDALSAMQVALGLSVRP